MSAGYPRMGTVLPTDFTTLSFGIETTGGEMKKIILKDTVIPVSRSQTFTTNQDDQETVKLQVYAGEGTMTNDCLKLVEITLDGIQEARRGEPQIQVTFEVRRDRGERLRKQVEHDPLYRQGMAIHGQNLTDDTNGGSDVG